MEDQTVDYHLQLALAHLEIALDISIQSVLENGREKKAIGIKWKSFLGSFLGLLREKGKQSRMNLLAWITFPRMK
jgi:hypothetical protein